MNENSTGANLQQPIQSVLQASSNLTTSLKFTLPGPGHFFPLCTFSLNIIDPSPRQPHLSKEQARVQEVGGKIKARGMPSSSDVGAGE